MDNSQNNNQKKFQIWMPLLLSMAVVGGMLIGMKLQSNTPNIVVKPKGEGKDKALLEQGKIEELIRYIEIKYVDEVDREKLLDKAIESIITELDPHSSYISSDQLKEVNEQLEGNFEGIGIEFLVLDDTVRGGHSTCRRPFRSSRYFSRRQNSGNWRQHCGRSRLRRKSSNQ